MHNIFMGENMIYVAVCDDDKVVCSQIENILLQYSKKRCIKIEVDVFYNGEGFLRYIKEGHNYDLLYLDIEMGLVNGVEVGKQLRKVYKNYSIEIVYISAKEGYDRQLFDVQPLHFIEKPIVDSVVIDDFKLALERGHKLGGHFLYKKRDKTTKKPKKMLTFALLYVIIDAYLKKGVEGEGFLQWNSEES